MKTYSWSRMETAPELQALLLPLSEEYPIFCEGDGMRIHFILRDIAGVRVRSTGERITVEYASLRDAARGIGLALAGLSAEETSSFDSLGIMIDCSRNAVIRPQKMKQWLRRLALLGYDSAMIYTEDTFLVPEEPVFGYQRGAYTLEELREMDDYAARLGIEMVPCIQTLGHMEQVIKWKEELGGTRSTLKTGEEDVYSMLDHVLAFWRRAFRSGKIQIGMDESWHETGSQFADELRAFKFRIFSSHLERVNELCRKHGYEHPMIWSDMYFNISSGKNFYFDEEVTFSDELKRSVPPNLRMAYWDYYHETPEIYRKMIAKHRELGFEPVMASGIRTTKSFWYDHVQTMRTVPSCIEACRQENIREIFFTMWGDDGAFCDYDSAFAGMSLCAELAWGGNSSGETLEKRFHAVCGGNYALSLCASGLQQYFHPGLDAWAPYLLWDDPLYGLVWRYFESVCPDFWKTAEERLRTVRDQLFPHREESAAGDFGNACALAALLVKKIQFRRDLLNAGNNDAWNSIAERAGHEMVNAVNEFSDSFRRQWRRRNKPEGLEMMQYRLSGLAERYRETARLIREFQSGDADALKMLKETRALPVFYLFHNCASPTRSIFH